MANGLRFWMGLVVALFLVLPFHAFAQDSDGDGMPDSFETANPCLNVNSNDAGVDYDGDGKTNLQEYTYSASMNPCSADSDFGGEWDGSEIDNARNPLDDSDDQAGGGLVTIGTGTGTWYGPLGTYYHDMRTTSLYFQSELGGAGNITSLALYVTTSPGQTMNAFTIRMKHTTSTSIPTSWDSSGWTVVYQNNEPAPATGWHTFDFSTPFTYNGTNNLLIDICFNNSSYTNDGYVRYSTTGSSRSIYYRTDSSYGDPLTWSGTSPTPSGTTYFPNVQLYIGNPVADVDSDGMPDSFEFPNMDCLDPLTDDADEDPDGDMMTNMMEYGGSFDPCVADAPDTDGDGASDLLEASVTFDFPCAYMGTCSSTGCTHLTYGDHNYLVCATNRTWAAARSSCQGFGGELISLNDSAENSWAAGNVAYAGYWVWNGFNDQASEGSWVWSNGDPVTYSHWRSGEPNGGTGENCAAFNRDNPAYWDDMPCTTWSLNYACEDGNVTTNINSADTDGDGMGDLWEITYGTHGAWGDSTLDYDGDSLSNMEEYNLGTNPMLADTDSDGSNDNVDCDPLDPNNWTSCATCLDGDSDSYLANCDAYVTIPGPDCDDADVNNWDACATCLDGDSDSYFLGCNQYVTIPGPDCDDANDNAWDACATCVDGDTDSWYVGCNQYASFNGPDCDDADVNNWDACATCADGDTDGYLAGCNRYVTIPGPDCDDEDPEVNPDATEVLCDLVDNDCSALTPDDPDMDGDGVGYCTEQVEGTSDNEVDSDWDGLSDYVEIVVKPCLDPTLADTDGDGLWDGWDEDISLDGVQDPGETDPCVADTDTDGLLDGIEYWLSCLDPLVFDSDLDPDGDGKTSLQEITHDERMNPCTPDTDFGGEWDGSEIDAAKDPLDAADDDPLAMVEIGTGDTAWEMPFNTGYHDARTQIIYLASEIGRAGRIKSLAFDVDVLPGQTMEWFSIRIKHTGASEYSSADLEDNQGWTETYFNWQEITQTGWVEFGFYTPFFYNGTDNLLIDVSFDNSSASTPGLALASLNSQDRSVWAVDNGNYNYPMDWSGSTAPDAFASGYVPNIRLEFGTTLADLDSDGMDEYYELNYDWCLDNMVDDALLDADTDGLTNYAEYLANTNPCEADSDWDGMDDYFEVNHSCLYPLNDDHLNDPDSDGYTSFFEYNNSLDPCTDDTDSDGMTDPYEMANLCLDPLVGDSATDYDLDGLSSLIESQAGVDPCDYDSDDDDMDDGFEYGNTCLDPNVGDSLGDPDSDSLLSIAEYGLGTSPCSDDTDSDGMSDLVESGYSCIDALVGDSALDADSDGASNLLEVQSSTDPCDPDSDDDGMLDGYEITYTCLDPNAGDSIGDLDSDGLGNFLEYSQNMNPCSSDSDSDGMSDSYEYATVCVDALVNDAALDADSDGASNLIESQNGLDPCDPDMDGDGLADGAEFISGIPFDCVTQGNCGSTGCTLRSYGGHNYLFCGSEITWASARSSCQGFGGELVALNDSAENSWVSGFLSVWDWYWHGFSDQSIEGYWQWSNGNAVTYTRWNSGEPNGGYGENCAGFNRTYKYTWDDLPCGWTQQYICEDAIQHTSPTDPDTDGDGMNDGFEMAGLICGLDPLNGDSTLDPDSDGLDNMDEMNLGTDPCVSDTDGDGVGDATDCDPTDPNNWTSCATCLDGDSDSWFDGCDDYQTINGPDCNDADPDNWTSCATCLDGDSDSWFAGCDAYATRSGPDCNDGDGDVYPGAPELCDSVDNQCPGDVGYGEIDEECIADVDGDGLSDEDENLIYLTDPDDPDTDGDGVPDGREELVDLTDATDASDFMTAAPRLLNYQGRLLDGFSQPITGQVAMTFEVYATSGGSTVLWMEGSTVDVADGIFNVILGGDTALPTGLFNGDDGFLKIYAGGEGLEPRRQIASQALALNSLRLEGALIETGLASTAADNASVVTVKVYFSRLYASPPRVALSGTDLDVNGETFVARSVSEVTGVGFTAVLESKSGNLATGDVSFTWMAHGE